MHALFLNPRLSLWPRDPHASRRGEAAAQAGEWPRAVREFQRAAGQPQAPLQLTTELLWAQIAAGDRTANSTASELVRRLAEEKDSELAYPLVANVLKLPLAEVETRTLLERTGQRLLRQRHYVTLTVHGAALYRAGRYQQADKILAEAVKEGKGGYVETWLFQALTAARLGRHDEAHQHLARVKQWHDRQHFSRWQERVQWQTLLAEANRVVDGPPRMPGLPEGE
jgi:tetratricopeptide (TPR) repeat protein